MPCKKVNNINLRDATLDNAPFAGIAGATYRNMPFDMKYRVVDDGAGGEARKDLVGYSAVFNKEFKTEFYSWTFIEKIAPGAFANALTKSDTRALFNHDANFPLAREGALGAGLVMREDEVGLWSEISPSDTSFARDLEILIADGVIKEQSFAFTIKRERWEEDNEERIVTRTILEIGELFDVSPVTFPAYKQTSISLRDAYNIWRIANDKPEFINSDIDNTRHVSDPPDDGLTEPMPVDDKLEPMPKSDSKHKKRERKLKLRQRQFKTRGMNR